MRSRWELRASATMRLALGIERELCSGNGPGASEIDRHRSTTRRVAEQASRSSHQLVHTASTGEKRSDVRIVIHSTRSPAFCPHIVASSPLPPNILSCTRVIRARYASRRHKSRGGSSRQDRFGTRDLLGRAGLRRYQRRPVDASRRAGSQRDADHLCRDRSVGSSWEMQ